MAANSAANKIAETISAENEEHDKTLVITEGDFDNFREGNIKVTERDEKAVVGEVETGKNVETHDKTITDMVRKTEVDVE